MDLGEDVESCFNEQRNDEEKDEELEKVATDCAGENDEQDNEDALEDEQSDAVRVGLVAEQDRSCIERKDYIEHS